jgi:methylenetetrahydrofolate dehydrogenase (NADP+)/methenyltetrahydrofolate cyclohydrolase
MTARIIDGKAIAQEIRAQCARRVASLQAQLGATPGLAVILVGDDPASAVYVRNKIRACEAAGIASFTHRLAADTNTGALLALIERLNNDATVNGILVQLPLPPQIDAAKALEAIAAEKDVDGFHLYNIGGLVAGRPMFAPCTPFGVMELLRHEHIEVEGANAVVVGASNIVGKPMALMLTAAGATVSVCHIKTRDISEFTRLADILVVAAGSPGLIKPAMVRPGATVIDVGINRAPNGRLVGDVDPEVAEVAGRLTPVPGGVGPMTVTMLLVNTIQSAERAVARSSRFEDALQ